MRKEDLQYIQSIFENNFDIKYREIQSNLGLITLIFIDTMVDLTIMSEHIISPLVRERKKYLSIEEIQKEIITGCIVEEVKDVKEAVQKIVSGFVIIDAEFSHKILCCNTKMVKGREPSIPPVENVVKGSREGFSEKINDNVSMIRKRILSPSLKFEQLLVGSKSKTSVLLVYLEDMAPSKLVEYIRSKIKEINAEYIVSANIIGEKLEAKKTSFQTVRYTEKPDIFMSKIVEGRVGVLVDNLPLGLTAPCFFIENFMSPDDYMMDKYTGNYIRVIRWFSLGASTLFPSLYVALTSHHFSLLPSIFAFRIAVSRSGVPFPIFLEIILMMSFFQLLREAGVRLPQQIGPAISIVGALILGDAAVRAGLSSDIAVLLVALASISAFLTPNISQSIAIWSTILILFSALLGLPGFFIGFIVLCSHLAGIRSCGYPYLYPIGTLRTLDFKEKLTRGTLKEISNNIFEDKKL